jgi:hypothetical protein
MKAMLHMEDDLQHVLYRWQGDQILKVKKKHANSNCKEVHQYIGLCHSFFMHSVFFYWQK